MANNLSKNVSITDYIHGPFCIVVNDLARPDDNDYPLVVSPEGGYKSKEEALQYIERFAHRKEPYLGLHFRIEQLGTPDSFTRFCSWED